MSVINDLNSIPKELWTDELKAIVQQSPIVKVNLLNRRIDFITIPTLIEMILACCQQQQKMLIASCNVHSFNLSMQLPWLHDYMRGADIVRCDGMGILKTVNYLGLDIKPVYRASGTKLIPALIEESRKEELSFFLLGSKAHYVDKAIHNVQERYPGIRIDGHHGYFDKHDLEACNAVLHKINCMQPDILIVGMGMPIQEDWIHRHYDSINAKVIIPCGAVIDRLAGRVSDCPPWVSSLGLEWLYRLMGEPKRLAARYLLGNPAFFLHILLSRTYDKPLSLFK